MRNPQWQRFSRQVTSQDCHSNPIQVIHFRHFSMKPHNCSYSTPPQIPDEDNFHVHRSNPQQIQSCQNWSDHTTRRPAEPKIEDNFVIRLQHVTRFVEVLPDMHQFPRTFSNKPSYNEAKTFIKSHQNFRDIKMQGLFVHLSLVVLLFHPIFFLLLSCNKAKHCRVETEQHKGQNISNSICLKPFQPFFYLFDNIEAHLNFIQVCPKNKLRIFVFVQKWTKFERLQQQTSTRLDSRLKIVFCCIAA